MLAVHRVVLINLDSLVRSNAAERRLLTAMATIMMTVASIMAASTKTATTLTVMVTVDEAAASSVGDE